MAMKSQATDNVRIMAELAPMSQVGVKGPPSSEIVNAARNRRVRNRITTRKCLKICRSVTAKKKKQPPNAM
jgi:hypothetical protein